jgi:regulator of sigma E protease
MNTSLLGGIIFVVVFAGIILVHELGHFVVARLLHIEVEEFGVGFPPRILGVVKDPANKWRIFFGQTVPALGESTRPRTIYSLNWIPLGGFNKIKGEDDPGILGGMAAANPWKRIVVLLAGVSMNLLTGVLVYSIFFSQVGVPDPNTAVVASVDTASPADKAGLQVGDVILAAGGVHITGYNLLSQTTRQYLDKPLPLIILRDGQMVEITLTPRSVYPATQGPMGIGVGEPLLPAKSWFATIPAAFSATGRDINSLLSLPGRIIAGTISPQEAQIGGPRSVWNLFQQAVARDVSSRQASPTSGSSTRPTNYTLLTIISLTITVAVANLLPIPALDGGRIFMTLPEILFRRRIPAKYQAAINGVSFLILLILLGFFYVKDIISPVAFTLP